MGKSHPVDKVKEATIPTTMLKAMDPNIQRSPDITILLILHQYEFPEIDLFIKT
jgi:hypothetical protein